MAHLTEPPFLHRRPSHPSYILHRPPCSSIALTEAHVKGFMAQILEGVAYLHAHRLMHR
jgi:serine/threonine protein kinase